MIRTEGVRKRFGRLEVLSGVSLSFEPGRVTAVIGPNGSGKTTLIKCMLGLVRPDQGTILMDGIGIGDDWRYRSRIGYMPQAARFPDNLTGREVLAMLSALREDSGEPDMSLVDAFGLESQLDKRLHTLSVGTRQKVNAVAAFMFSAPVLILDEPTASLDPVASGVLKDAVRGARAEGRTVLLTSHVMSEVEELADDLVLLLEGKVRWAGAVSQLVSRAQAGTLEQAIARLMLDREAEAA